MQRNRQKRDIYRLLMDVVNQQHRTYNISLLNATKHTLIRKDQRA